MKQTILLAPDDAVGPSRSRPLVAEMPEGAVSQAGPLRAGDVKALLDARTMVAVDDKRLFVVGPRWRKAVGIPLEATGVRSCVIDLLSQDNDKRVTAELRPGTRGDEIASLAQIAFEGPSTVRLWDSASCSLRLSREFKVGLDDIFLGRDAIGTVENNKNLTVIAVNSAAPTIQISFEEWIGDVAISSDGTIFAIEKFGKALCACRKEAAKSNSNGQDACRAQSSTHTCFPIHRYNSVLDAPDKITMSPGGRLAVITQARRGRIEIGKLGKDWQFAEVSSQSIDSNLAQEQPAFALSADQRLLAVPGDGKGVKILDTNSMTVVAELPTGSKVSEIVFLGDASGRIATLDHVVRIWDWRTTALIEKACKRWPVNFAIETGVPPPLSRAAICGSAQQK
jgi:hypothetical protein